MLPGDAVQNPAPAGRSASGRFVYCVYQYQNYLHQLSFEGSADAGYGRKRYAELGTMWFIRIIVVEYGRPAIYDDVLEARTWVSDFRRFRSHREYVLTHVPSGDEVLRGRADWVYLDVHTLWPKRLPPDILAQFDPDGQTAVEPVSRADEPDSYPEAVVTTIPWSVRWRDADEAGHVNNAVYTSWFEEAMRHALGDAPAPSTRHRSSTCARSSRRRVDRDHAASLPRRQPVTWLAWVMATTQKRVPNLLGFSALLSAWCRGRIQYQGTVHSTAPTPELTEDLS